MTLPLGEPVTPVTIVVQKSRFRRLGIMIEHRSDELPRVYQTDDDRFKVGDILYVTNGRYVTGTHALKWMIWRHTHISITVLRRGNSESAIVLP